MKLASALADKIKAIDVLKTPGLDNPEVRARFETYLSLKEVPQARIDEYFGKMKQVSAMLKNSDYLWRVETSLFARRISGPRCRDQPGTRRPRREFLEHRPHQERPRNGQRQISQTMPRPPSPTPIWTPTISRMSRRADECKKYQGQRGAAAQSQRLQYDKFAASESGRRPDRRRGRRGADHVSRLAGQAGDDVRIPQPFRSPGQDQAQRNPRKQDERPGPDGLRRLHPTLYQTHRYYHVIIAADFYRALFNEGDYPYDLGNQAVAGRGK